MRNVSIAVRRVIASLALLVVLAVPAAAYEEPPTPTEPPQARISPPGGIVAEPESSVFESFIDWLVFYARISPPIG